MLDGDSLDPGSLLDESNAQQLQGAAASTESVSTENVNEQVVEQAAGELDRMFSDQLAKGPEAPALETPAVAQPEVPVDASRGAADRIRQVIAQRNEAREAQALLQRQLTEQQMVYQKQQAEFQARQMEFEQRRLAMQEQRYQQEQDSNLSEVEKARRSFLNDAAAQAKADLAREMLPELAAVKEELARERAIREESRKEAERQQRYQAFSAQAQRALDNELLAGFEPARASKLKEPLEEMLYSFSGAYGVTPEQAAPAFKALLDEYAAAKMRKTSQVGGAAIARNQTLPSSIPTGRTGVSPQRASPSLAQLKANNLEDHIAWAARGYPPLRPL